VFLSLSADFLNILYYETDASPFSSVLLYSIVSLRVLNGSVDGDDDTDDGDDSFGFNNMLSFIMQSNKI
jgi:hypothetical protein